jgi:uncharacterized membrane protein YdjX (TVP38/TMEM64 family)
VILDEGRKQGGKRSDHTSLHPLDMTRSRVKGSSSWRRVGLLVILVAALVGLGLCWHMGCYDIRPQVVKFFDWLDRLGPWAPVLFMLVDMLVVVLVLPGVILTLGAGFTFGVLKGSIYVVIATTLGATVAFLMARHLFGQRVSRFLLTHSKLKHIDYEFSRQGWKIVFLTRLVPFFPFKLSNYFFGLMQISLRDFVLGVFFGIIPITVNNVYIGSIAAELTTIASGAHGRSPLQWALYGIGFLAAIVVVIYLRRLARKALDGYIPKGAST